MGRQSRRRLDQRRDGEIVWLLLEDVGMQACEAIGSEAASLQEWLGDVRIRPGSLPPLQRALAE